ncbi:MAG: phage terminase large subunit [Pseudomonadota bacterium]|nr:phage terminase large subunit [Pseudomonadota bacterium]
MPEWFDHLLTHDLPTFIGKTIATTDPGTTYLPNWHIDLIAEYLQAIESGEITRLIINMPPRSLKSVSVSVAWPAWLLGHDPARRILAASYSSALALKHSIDCRAVLASSWYRRVFPDMLLARDQNEKSKFMTTRRGYRMAVSVGGGVTGEGGNFLIIDDPLSPAQAMSASSRNQVNDWFDHSFVSRIDDKQRGAIVLVMQRLHLQDLAGYLLAKGGWQHLSLPAVAPMPHHHDFGRVHKFREADELLHPMREDEELIERAKIELGSAAFSAQYQQQPLPEEGAMVRAWWIRRYEAPPLPADRRVQSWDTAIKSGMQHDASACLTFAESEGHCHLLDVQLLRCEYPDLKRAFYALAERWQPQAILIEDRASGQQLLQDVRRESHLPVIPIQPRGDKITRFAAVSAMIEAGKLLLPAQAPWLSDFESELFAFPSGAHDDQVDALAQYLDWLRSSLWEKLRIRRI